MPYYQILSFSISWRESKYPWYFLIKYFLLYLVRVNKDVRQTGAHSSRIWTWENYYGMYFQEKFKAHVA
jgi:hypothetical protein